MSQKQKTGKPAVPNDIPGSNWPNLKAPEKLEILQRYRENLRKRDEGFLVADDFFLQSILDEGLEAEYMHHMSCNDHRM
jgi:hypothetical protein